MKFEDVENFYRKIDLNRDESSSVESQVSCINQNQYAFETIDKTNNGLTLLFKFNEVTRLEDPEINYEKPDLTDFSKTDYHSHQNVGWRRV